jgi:glycosyltransferase involved in cell wall biosynthesis
MAMLLATPGRHWGGMEKHVADLAGELAASGHELHILAHRHYADRFARPIAFHPLPVQLGRRNPWLHWRVTSTLKRLKPDIAHAHGNKAAQVLGRVPASGWQTVGTVHGSKSDLTAFAALDKVIAVSQAALDRLKHPRRFQIANGIPAPVGTADLPAHWRAGLPGATRTDSNTVQVIAAGRLEPVKGFEALITAWKQVVATHPNAQLTVFGEGSLRDRLLRHIQHSGLAGRVTLAGHHPNLPGLLEHADLFVISSQREGFPYTLVEALQAGCPVVSTPVAGCMELLPTAAITKNASPEALANALTEALGRLGALREKQAPAFAYAREHLTLTAMATATLAVYEAPLPCTKQRRAESQTAERKAKSQ